MMNNLFFRLELQKLDTPEKVSLSDSAYEVWLQEFANRTKLQFIAIISTVGHDLNQEDKRDELFLVISFSSLEDELEAWNIIASSMKGNAASESVIATKPDKIRSDLKAELESQLVGKDLFFNTPDVLERLKIPKEDKKFDKEIAQSVVDFLLKKDRHNATEKLVIKILKDEKIYTTRDDEKSEMWIYKDGIYIPQAKTFIKEHCRMYFGVAYTNTIANEVISKIESETFIEQKDFFIIQDAYELPVLNGVINLKTKKLRSFDKNKDRFFAKIPVIYDVKSDCKEIKKFFRDILKNEEDIQLMQELFGFCLVKDYFIEKAIMFTGSGRNGKGKTIELIKRFLGVDNCVNISLQTLEQDQYAKGELFNKMANLGADISKHGLKTTSEFKTLTGHDLVSSNRKFLNRLSFVNYAKMIFSANEIPLTYDLTPAFFNRWIILEFLNTYLSKEEYESIQNSNISKEEKLRFRLKDSSLINKISTPDELSGLLNWALIGLERLLKNSDFSYSKSTEEVKKIWLRKSSSINAFCMDCVEECFEGEVSKEEFRQAYAKYCRQHKLIASSDQIIKKVLTENFGAGEEQIRDDSTKERVRVWTGIVLNVTPYTTGTPNSDSIGNFKNGLDVKNDVPPVPPVPDGKIEAEVEVI